MNEHCVSLADWDRDGNRYTYPADGSSGGWMLHGFTPVNERTLDLYGWFGFVFEVEVKEACELEVQADVVLSGEVNAEEKLESYTWRGYIAGSGKQEIALALNQFSMPQAQKNRWKYFRSITINHPVTNLRAVRRKKAAVVCETFSKSGEAEEEICYSFTVANCTGKPLGIHLGIRRQSTEILVPSFSWENALFEPFEQKVCTMMVRMSERVAKGGFEKQTVFVIPDGDGASAETITFYTVRRLPHPYLAHTASGWKEVCEKAEKYPWARAVADEYIDAASEWQVPEIDETKPYLFMTHHAHMAYRAAISWRLTGEQVFLDKAAELILAVIDPQKGYPKTWRACHQQMVHEGEFFKSLALCYDLLYDALPFTKKQREAAEQTFRMFVNRIDWELNGGGISNWSLAMLAGALFSAMILQDRERIERLVFGENGILEHLSRGLLNDGWWCECTVGYNQMVAGLFLEYGQALKPWGINLDHWWVPAQYADRVQPDNELFDGLSWDIYGATDKNYRCVLDLWNGLVQMPDYRGVVLGVNDCGESKFTGRAGVGLDPRYDMAYTVYRQPEYADIVKKGGERFRDLLHGVGELPDTDDLSCRKSCYFDNAGIAILRTQTKDRPEEKQIQAALKYGSHGGAHGHYDRCSLLSIMRYGRSVISPENIWYSYGSYLYKFFVQNSVNHSMVTVDLKQQDPSPGRQLLFYGGRGMQVAAVENNTRWCHPPYGGWRTVPSDTSFEQRVWEEGRYVPVPPEHPEYTTRSGFTEIICQRRLMTLTDDYIVLFDYVEGDTEHTYDNIYHLMGYTGMSGNAVQTGFSEQLTTDPVSCGQFITECSRYHAEGGVRLSYSWDFTEQETGHPQWLTMNRTGYNVPGHIDMDVYYAEPQESEIILGYDPGYANVNKKLFYRVEGDGAVLAQGKFGAWILGRDDLELDITKVKTLTFHVRTEDAYLEYANSIHAEKTIFWGDPRIETADGRIIYLAELAYRCENVDEGNGIGRDYFGGPVKLQGRQFDRAVPADPIDTQKEGIITVDLSGLDAVKLYTAIGGDYPLGDETRTRRRFSSQRVCGRRARFISVIEIYDGQVEKRVQEVTAEGEDCVFVRLKDGKSQRIRISGMESREGTLNAVLETYDRDGNKTDHEEAESVI